MTSQIQEIEDSIEYNKLKAEKGQRALRLAGNPDFQALVMEGYFKEFAQECTYNLADPAFAGEHVTKDSLILQLEGIASFRRWLQIQVQMAKQAENEIRQAEQALEEIRSEGEDN